MAGRENHLPNMREEGMAIAGFILGYISSVFSLVLVASILIVGANGSANFRKEKIISSENNLKQIGLAFRIWAGDNGDQFPFNVSQTKGGTHELCEIGRASCRE